MITEQDLEQAIAECQGERNPNANTCIKLAAFLTIKKEMFGKKQDELATKQDQVAMPQYSYTAEPQIEEPIDYESDTEFGKAVLGMEWRDILPLIDELMSTLKVTNRRLYDAVMRRL